MARRHTAVLALLLLAVAGCAGADSGEGEDAPRSPAYQRADRTLLPASALPEGWREVTVQERLGSSPGIPHYCGVRAAPADVAEGRITTYDEGRALDRYVIVWSMVAEEEKDARQVMNDLAAHRVDCVQEDGRTGRAIATEVGDESIGWAFDEPVSSAFQTIVFRRDEVVVVVAAPAATVLPDAEQREIAAAIDQRLQEG